MIWRRPFEVVVAMLIPPLATVLVWNDVVRRRDLSAPLRGWWVVVAMAPGVGPLLYVGVGGGRLW